MKTKNQTKKALLMSALSLLLCFSMLIGTTFAWFTDSVSTTNNIIKAGNLDMELWYSYDFLNWKEVSESSEIFDDATLWEPGHTEVVYFKVKNVGTLSFKYQLGVNIVGEVGGTNVAGESFKLSDYIMFGVDEEGVTDKYDDRKAAVAEISADAEKISAGYTKERSTLSANSEEIVALVVYMPETVGNEANYKKGTTPPQITLGIDVFATQVEYESEKDSYGPDYDEDAPIVMDSVTTEAGKNAQLNFAAAPSTITSSTIIDIPADALPVGSIVTATIDTDNSLFKVNAAGAVVGAINVEMKVDGVDFDGELAAGEYFTVTTYISKGLENVSVKYTGTDGKADAIYESYDPATGKLVFKTNHFSEYAVSGKALAYDTKNDVAFSKIDDVVEVLVSGEATIVIPEANKTTEFKGALEEAIAELPEEDQTIVQENLADVLYAAVIGETKYATLEDALKAAKDGDTIVFLNDVIITSNWDARFTGGKMTNSVTIDGNGKTIKFTSTTDDKNHFAAFRFEKDAIVKNLTFDFSDAIGTGDRARAISAKANLVVENCTFIGNPDITNDRAIIFGEGAGAAIGNVEVSISGCTFVDWKKGVGDNENAQDAKNVAVKNNTFTNASVAISACDTITFTGNKMNNGYVSIMSYSNAENLEVVANNNVLDETKDNTIGKTFYVVSAKSMQKALDSGLSNITVIMTADIAGDIIVVQPKGMDVDVVIDGNGKTFDGQIAIHGESEATGKDTLKIKNINFVTSKQSGYSIVSTDTSGKVTANGSIVRYAHNVTIDNCTFTASGAAVHTAASISFQQAYNITVTNCTATNMHSLMQAQSCSSTTITVEGCKVVNGKNGISLGNTKNAIVKNCVIESVVDYGYGLRVDANGAYNLTVEGCTITADAPVLLRKATGAYTATLTNNTLVSDNGYRILTTAADYEEGKELTAATGTLNITVDGCAYVLVRTADELVEALENGKNVIFANNIKIDPANMSNAYGKTGINVKNGQTIDGNGYTLDIKGAGGTWDSGINTTGGVIKNLTVTGSFRGIFINHTSTYSEKVVLENVIIRNVVYTISCDQGLYQGIEATNCEFYGWTSFAKDAGEAKFVNCYFGEGSGYKYCRPYSNTEFVKCTFCPGYTVDKTQAQVTFTDCTFEE